MPSKITFLKSSSRSEKLLQILVKQVIIYNPTANCDSNENTNLLPYSCSKFQTSKIHFVKTSSPGIITDSCLPHHNRKSDFQL